MFVIIVIYFIRGYQMSTYLFKNKELDYIPLSSYFIERYVPKARGEFLKVYLLTLKYCLNGELSINSEILASKLNLLESDIMNAWDYWYEENVINFTKKDNYGTYTIEFLDLSGKINQKKEPVNIVNALKDKNIQSMFEEIEKCFCRPLSSAELSTILFWLDEYNYSPDTIVLLFEYCSSKDKKDIRYIERTLIKWHDNGVRDIEGALKEIKRHEGLWNDITKVQNFMGIKDRKLAKPEEEFIQKWLDELNFSTDIIYKACEISLDRFTRIDFKYINGILANWKKSGIENIKDLEAYLSKKKSSYKPPNSEKKKQTNANFEQRSYTPKDFKDLEKKLLGWDEND